VTSQPEDKQALAALLPDLVGRWLADQVSHASPDDQPDDRRDGGDQPDDEQAMRTWYRSIEGTVVSADISGFTRFAESLADAGPRLAAETLNRTINRCFAPMIDEIIGRGGDVLKFGGDALFAFFDGRDHAPQAAATAHALQRLLATGVVVEPSLTMTVGVATGPVQIVLAGTSRRELVVFGPTVDTCLTLESQAEPGEVLVSPATAKHLPAQWVRAEGEVQILVGPADHVPPPPPHELSAPNAARSGLDWARLLGPELASAVEAYIGTAGELRMVTVAFVELPTERLPPRTIFDTVTGADETFRRYGVSLLSTDVSTGGVKLFVVAGAPTAGENDEDAMLGALDDLVHQSGAPPMRAGVNRGVVYVGFLGSNRCRTLTAMGDPTNLAARLLQKAQPSEIAVADTVLDHARAAYPTTPRQPVLVKGRLAPVVFSSLDGPARQTRSPRMEPKVQGRREELSQLLSAVDQAREGRGSALKLVGAAGLGARRLLSEAAAELPSGVLTLAIDGGLGSVRPFAAVRPVLRGLSGLEGRSDDVESLRRWVSRLRPQVEPLLPLLAPAFGVSIPTNTTVQAIDPEFRELQANQAILDLLTASLPVSTVFLVPHAHRLDQASAQLCRAIADHCADRPWCLLASSRPGSDVLPDVPELRLAPLSQTDIAALLADVGDLAANRVQELAEVAGGNPRFALELIRAHDAGEPLDRLDLSSIEALITSRIDRLGHRPRVMVRSLAVAGRRFTKELAGRLLEAASLAEPHELADLLDRLAPEAGLIHRDRNEPDWYLFSSGAAHRVAHEGLSIRRRRELHGWVAQVLEEQGGDVAELALHHGEAGNRERCFDLSRAAAARAVDLGLMSDAAGHLQRAIDMADQGPPALVAAQELDGVLLSLFEAAFAARRYHQAIEVGNRLLERLPDTTKRTRLLLQLCSIKADLDGSFAEQAERLDREVERLEVDRSADRAWLAGAVAGFRYRLGQLDEALSSAKQAIVEADRSGSATPKPRALLIRHAVESHRADPAAAATGQELLEVAGELNDHRTLISAHNNIGFDYQEVGRWDDAGHHYGQAIELARQTGDADRGSPPAINLAVLLLERGRWDDARQALDELRRVTAATGNRLDAAQVRRELGRLEIYVGRAQEGRRLLTDVRAFYKQAGLPEESYEVALLSLAADLADGLSQQVLDGARELPQLEDLSASLLGRRELLIGYATLQQARAEDALTWFEEAEKMTDGIFPYGQARALVGRAAAERVAGRVRTSTNTRAQAQSILDRLGVTDLPFVPLPQ
jgi:class 3 adenylate cyclase/tetratricopeptide (TPR) repeat protein